MRDALPGYRLHKLEVLNWGTFDSTRGTVHTVRTDGATTLLIGQNGSGKSTLVDALLTLLVRTGVRNYNVAAGAQKQERDERSYIKGAYDRKSREEDNRAEVLYLRPEGRHFSALLATFRNDRDVPFTIALVLYLNADGGSEKIYCVAQGEKSIAKDLAGLDATDRVKKELLRRGFRVTDKYSEYHAWLTREFHIRPKAMDMFNQTVAVKDIQSLNKFIREHMLEATSWADRLDNLQTHFTQLTQAHQTLVRVRLQFELLEPIEKKAKAYTADAAVLAQSQALLDAGFAYFRQKTIDVLEPAIGSFEQQLVKIAAGRSDLESQLEHSRDEERRIKNEIESSGGDRLRAIPLLIRAHRAECDARKERHRTFQAALSRSALGVTIADDVGFTALQAELSTHASRLERDAQTMKGERDKLILDRGDASKELSESKRELDALAHRQSKLPESFAEVRRSLCQNLRLPEAELPFVAEIIAVLPEEREWESSIEMVLRPFALSLLVPQRLYTVVSAHINHTRIHDERGRGQKLVYLRVGERTANPVPRAVTNRQSLLKKIRLRDNHPLVPWVKGELEHRFDLFCCETIAEFQAAHDYALTRERHVKMGAHRHEKDDRERTADPRFYVLGWDNKEKRRYLQAELERLTKTVAALDAKIDVLDKKCNQLDIQRSAVAELSRVASYSLLDFKAEELAIAALETEQRVLEESSDTLRALKVRLAAVVKAREALQEKRDQTIFNEASISTSLSTAKRDLDNARSVLAELKRADQYDLHVIHFVSLDARFMENPLTAADLGLRESEFREVTRKEIERLRKELEPLQAELHRLMAHYLREFRDESDELDSSIKYLGSFCTLCEQIRKDDLPRHELRFKERLNEKVLQEIGLLNGAFLTEKGEIEQKIELLNQSLRQLPYREGTFMRLEPRPIHDPDILAFQADLRECLSGSFEGTAEANEARYLRIERILSKLRDEAAWRQKVTDIRRWFDFAAREIEEATGRERSYYEDSAGQSGGEKAKLAFTILVAAIAYQYDIDPMQPSSDRLHFVVVDEMFSKVDDKYAEYALELFRRFGLQLLIVAPLDAKARVTEPYVQCYLHVVKDPQTSLSDIFTMTAREFDEAILVRTRSVSLKRTTVA